MTEQTPPRDTEPGGESTPYDTEGDGPVGLEDRTSTDEKGSPATNQGKAEPMSPSPAHADPSAPLDPPSLDDMNVGAADPQRPSLGLSAATTGSGAGGPLASSSAAVGGPAGLAGPARPQGPTSSGEHVETDVQASAAAMGRDTGRPSGSGDPHGVDSVGETPSEGTSEEHGVVQGARIPVDDDGSSTA